MCEVYGTYMKNCRMANTVCQEVSKSIGGKRWIEICHSQTSDITEAWNLDALLVKPNQRMTKYPLLLMELLKTTPEDHPDYSALVKANSGYRQALVRINTYMIYVETLLPQIHKDMETLMQSVPTTIDYEARFGTKRSRMQKMTEPFSGLTRGKKEEKQTNQQTNQLTMDAKNDYVLDAEGKDIAYLALEQRFGRNFMAAQILFRDFQIYLDAVGHHMAAVLKFFGSVLEFMQCDENHGLFEVTANYVGIVKGYFELATAGYDEHVSTSLVLASLLWLLTDAERSN